MGSFVVLVLILLVITIYVLWKDNRGEEEHQQESDANKDLYDQTVNQTEKEQRNTETIMENEKGTRDLFLETLTKIGCQYELEEEKEDCRIFFAYQGEHFSVVATNGVRLIQIYDIQWGHVDLYDIDEFTRLRKAINESNLNNNVTTVYTIDEAGSNVYVHSRYSILFVPQIPDIENYLRWALNEFFVAHQRVGNEMAKLREKEDSNT